MYKAKVSFVALLVLAVFATVLTGCGRKGLIVVNGEKISKDEFYGRLEQVPVQTTSGTKPAGQYVIEQIIGEQLMQQFAKDKGVAPTEAQINKKIDFIKKQSGGNLNKLLAQQGSNLDTLKKKVALEQSFINVASRNVKISDAEVKSAYDKLLASPNSPFKSPDQVKISVIVTKSKDNMDKAYQMLSNGQEFSAVASAKNDDDNLKKSGGVLAMVGKNDPRLPKQIVNAAFSLSVGSYSKPFKVQNDWVVVKADQKKAAEVKKYDEVKDMIKERLAIQKGTSNKDFAKELEEYTQKANININASRYKNIVANIKKDAAKALETMGQQGTQTTSAPGK